MFRMFRVPFIPALVAVAALVATLATLGPEGNGPGVTCDEVYHVNQGKELITALRHQRLAFFLPNNIRRNFDWPVDGAPVQAPLGYWILGATHWFFDPEPDNPSLISIGSARFAPAVAFALLVLLVGWWTTRREGAVAGIVAAIAVAIMPRLFAHAHLASLDMLTTLFFVAAVLAVAEAARGGRAWHFVLAGVLWGAAMLVRLHGLLIAPPVMAWLIWHFWRREVVGGDSCRRASKMPPENRTSNEERRFPRSVSAAAAWMVGGVATFFLGWPWLWLAPFAHLWQYVDSGSARQPLHVFYWGQVWADRDVPWHYPWVTFAVTVPVGLLLLGIAGLWVAFQRRKARATSAVTEPEAYSLLAATMIFVLALFSWPSVPVYDGVRLFLMVFPLLAIFVGIGAARLVSFGSPLLTRQRTIAVFALVALQATGLLVYHPCQLSYYNLLVGGLRGAERLGFEVTYWGDTVREPMLAKAAALSPDAPLLLAPSLAPYQAPAVAISSPALRTAGVRLVGPDAARDCRYAVVYNRRADAAAVAPLLVGAEAVMESELQGVWTARLVRLSPLDSPARSGRMSASR